MAISIKNLTFGQTTVFNDAKTRLIGVTATPEYVDGKATDKIIGTTYLCLAEKNGFEKINVKTTEMTPIVDQASLDLSDETVYLTFEGFEGKFWYNSRISDYSLSCKADKAKIVTKKQ